MFLSLLITNVDIQLFSLRRRVSAWVFFNCCNPQAAPWFQIFNFSFIIRDNPFSPFHPCSTSTKQLDNTVALRESLPICQPDLQIIWINKTDLAKRDLPELPFRVRWCYRWCISCTLRIAISSVGCTQCTIRHQPDLWQFERCKTSRLWIGFSQQTLTACLRSDARNRKLTPKRTNATNSMVVPSCSRVWKSIVKDMSLSHTLEDSWKSLMR